MEELRQDVLGAAYLVDISRSASSKRGGSGVAKVGDIEIAGAMHEILQSGSWLACFRQENAGVLRCYQATGARGRNGPEEPRPLPLKDS